jgi:hypothetical protein
MLQGKPPATNDYTMSLVHTGSYIISGTITAHDFGQVKLVKATA